MKNKFSSKKFLFVSWESLSGDLAWQVKKEGHQVKSYIKDREDKDVFDGFFEKVNSWKKYIDWADVIVFDDVGFGDVASALRKKGKLVVGGSVYTDKLEEDRKFGQTQMEKYGMVILPNWEFSDYDRAESFIKKNPGRYVLKPNYPSGTGQDFHSFLFLGEEDDGRDIAEMIKLNKDLLKAKIKSFQLQKFASGIEVAVGAFFNGEDFIYPINVNFEHKRLFSGELGPFTGEMGTAMFWSNPNRIFKETLLKAKDALKKSGYVGYIDINCIVNDKGIYPLEWTSRFGYPCVNIQLEGIATPFGEFLYRLANREKFELKTKKGFQLGVVVAVPPFLFYTLNNTQKASNYHDLPILFRKPNPNFDGIHLGDVKLEGRQIKVAGVSGYILIVTGSGATLTEARNQTYDRVKNIRLQNMFYRNDIGLRCVEDCKNLSKWHYL